MKAALVALALAGCSLTPAQRTGTLAGLATVSLSIDWLQTRDIVKRCNELNPVIGECGQRVSPDIYFPVVILGTLAAGYLIGGAWGDATFAAMAGAETATVWANALQ